MTRKCVMMVRSRKSFLKPFKKGISGQEVMRRLKKANPKVYGLLKNPTAEVNLAFNTKILRNKKGLSPEALAAQAQIFIERFDGIENYLCDSERGPTVTEAEQIAKALGVRIETLFKSRDWIKYFLA